MIIDFSLILIIFLIHFFVYKNKKKIFGSYFLDVPDQKRKIHQKSTYLIGGHFVILSYLIFLLFSFDNDLNEKLVLFFIHKYFFGWDFDDLKITSPQITLILIIYLTLTYFDNSFLLKQIYFETFEKTCILVLIVILYHHYVFYFINAINLIDGINGLAMMIFIIFYLFLYFFKN